MKKFAVLITTLLLAFNYTFANTLATSTPASSPMIHMSEAATSLPPHHVVVTIDPNLKGVDILPAITKKYEGKVVLLDFWATWCGPCRAAMKKLDTIKEDLMKKGVVFVYITGETSPLKNWEPMIANIKGEHYRLTNSQWTDLCGLLNIPGIPAYMLLNKDGSVAYSNLSTGGYPGNDILQNNIEVALTK